MKVEDLSQSMQNAGQFGGVKAIKGKGVISSLSSNTNAHSQTTQCRVGHSFAADKDIFSLTPDGNPTNFFERSRPGSFAAVGNRCDYLQVADIKL